MDLNSLKRKELVEVLKTSGIKDEQVLIAIGTVKRENFVNEEFKRLAYENTSLPINSNQTISQPYTVAFMTELLKIESGEKVLEIGTGSGYQSAVLKELGAEVYSVERITELFKSAEEKLKKSGYEVHLKCDDGTKGWIEFAPFDKIIVTAGSPKIPKKLLEQLSIGGRMIIPVGDENSQELVLIKKEADDLNESESEVKAKYKMKRFKDFKFVPLIGEEAWGNNY
ncbi:MAG: protein-L-isoaspartate(D-aspartate) O-methyltransferase [Ignavibacteria bacterium]|nr:protein-L-isoaspartate(D-aspartate) O-methyltransferase [Ignavibacteria bacterium]